MGLIPFSYEINWVFKLLFLFCIFVSSYDYLFIFIIFYIFQVPKF